MNRERCPHFRDEFILVDLGHSKVSFSQEFLHEEIHSTCNWLIEVVLYQHRSLLTVQDCIIALLCHWQVCVDIIPQALCLYMLKMVSHTNNPLASYEVQ